jgi:predicted metalloprotease
MSDRQGTKAQDREKFRRRLTRARRAAILCAAAMLVGGCSTVLDGRAVSLFDDPFRVGGLPAADGDSGPRPDAPQPTGTVRNTANGDVDKLALLSINDIEQFWKQQYGPPLAGLFKPVKALMSYDSTNPRGPAVCRNRTYKEPNAFYTSRCDLIAWDRGSFLPTARRYFGDMSVPGVLAHEYGHALQQTAKLVDRKTPVLVREQQADCFAGVYLFWVAEGKSPRFRLSTGDGLDHLLAGVITTRDPVLDTDEPNADEHGSALDRVSAFQMGFTTGDVACASINRSEIERRRGDLPTALRVDRGRDPETGEVPIDKDSLSTLMELLGNIFAPKQPPTLSYDLPKCSDAKAGPPASYCPRSNVISVDLPKLHEMAQVAGEKQHRLPQGDDTALSIVMSRYVLALQRERGLPLDTPWTALRTACLTGVAHRRLAEPIEVPSQHKLVLTAGDLDEAVSGLLINRVVASDVNGVGVPAGFTRIAAFREGVAGDTERCFQRWP